MDDWKKFNEISLSQKEAFYSHLNMEDITDADYAQAKNFEIKSLGEYNDLCVQSNTLLLADVFMNLLLTLLFIIVLKYMNLIPLVFFQFLD